MTTKSCLKLPKYMIRAVPVAAALAIAVSPHAMATENGNSQYSPGSSGFFGGAIPSMPGVYALSQTSYSSSDRLNGSNGDKSPLDFGLDVKVETIRLLGVTNAEVRDGKFFWQLVLPIVLDLKTHVGSHGGSDSGLGDVTLSSGLAWHKGPNTYVVGLDVGTPTGSYDSSKIANTGVNHWSLQPTFGYHYLDFQNPTWEFSVQPRYIKNLKNSDTHYTSGDEIVIDFAAGRYFGPVRLGVVGYALQQVTDDSGTGAAADGNRSRGVALGPSITYTISPGTQLGLWWQKELASENRSQGDTWQLSFSTKF